MKQNDESNKQKSWFTLSIQTQIVLEFILVGSGCDRRQSVVELCTCGEKYPLWKTVLSFQGYFMFPTVTSTSSKVHIHIYFMLPIVS